MDDANQPNSEISLASLFTDPPSPPTPEATVATYERERAHQGAEEWKKIDIRLVGAHPLWGHYLWNAARALASYLDENQELYRDLNVLELGAGGALPSIVAVKNGARKVTFVVVTDYPDDALVHNMTHNIEANTTNHERNLVEVKGYIWGRSVQPLLDALPPSPSSGFNLIILSDLLFNHSQHDALLSTCELTLSSCTGSTVLVFYSHHRPHLAHRDMEFFEKARSRNWICEKILTRIFSPMFIIDSGDESVRSTVHGWRMLRPR